MDEAKYPSGAPTPQYGPTTEEEFITDGLEWALAMLVARDEMNAAVHCVPVRLSPVTVKTRTALGLWRQWLDLGANNYNHGFVDGIRTESSNREHNED